MAGEVSGLKTSSDFQSICGKGAYAVTQAARLTGVSSQRIRRWLRGYSYQSHDKKRTSPSVWKSEWPVSDNSLVLSFRDLLEIRVVDALRKQGVSWRAIRLASNHAKEVLKTSHPFSSQKFQTDGRRIFTDIKDDVGEPKLLELVNNTYAFREIMKSLMDDVEFAADSSALRWYPLPSRDSVVLDPKRSFGQPIVTVEGVPTRTLYRAYKAERSIEKVADWYDVSPKSIRDAIAFEKRLSA